MKQAGSLANSLNTYEMEMDDPMERIIGQALEEADIEYHDERELRFSKGLDFFLPDQDLHIEVKQFHSPRISEQMSRADNVIAIQGIKAARFVAELIEKASAYDDMVSAAEDRAFDDYF